MPLPYHLPVSPSASIELVRATMARRRMSQRELADRVGVPREQLARILAGKVPFPHNPRTLAKLAEALGLDPADFGEYRQRLNVLPESTRRLVAHLEATGVSHETFKGRVTRMGSDALHLLLTGGAPFPTDPRVIEDLATAAGAVPFLFPEYMPLDRYGDRLRSLAGLALAPEDRQRFRDMLEVLQGFLERVPAVELDELVVSRMRGPAGAEDAAGGLRAFLPAWEALQPEVQELVRRLELHGWSPTELAKRAGVDRDELLAYLKGQLRLKDPTVRDRLMTALEEGHDGQDPARGR